MIIVTEDLQAVGRQTVLLDADLAERRAQPPGTILRVAAAKSAALVGLTRMLRAARISAPAIDAHLAAGAIAIALAGFR
jgi:hypothetical protein